MGAGEMQAGRDGMEPREPGMAREADRGLAAIDRR